MPKNKNKGGGMTADIYSIHDSYSCAPNVYYDKSNIYNRDGRYDTCYSKDILLQMIKAYNQHFTDDKISVGGKGEISKQELWNILNEKLKGRCSNEVCWIYQPFVKKLPEDVQEEIEEFTFKPERPFNKKQGYKGVWLSNEDIEKVMQQYERIYPDFKFLGPFPIDYEEYKSHYKFSPNTPVKYLSGGKNYDRIGMIFNTGTLRSGGQHWVAMFIDLTVNPYSIEFFDSAGNPPQNAIKKVITEVKDWCQDKCKNTNEYVKQLRHQRGNSECGVYCLWFITERLKGKSYVEIQANFEPDKVIEQFRSKFFSKRKEKKMPYLKITRNVAG